MCGLNNRGQLGIDLQDQEVDTTKIFKSFIDDVQKVACGAEHTMILLKVGLIMTAGTNSNFQLGLNDSEI